MLDHRNHFPLQLRMAGIVHLDADCHAMSLHTNGIARGVSTKDNRVYFRALDVEAEAQQYK
jgi:hypothetical protein